MVHLQEGLGDVKHDRAANAAAGDLLRWDIGWRVRLDCTLFVGPQAWYGMERNSKWLQRL